MAPRVVHALVTTVVDDGEPGIVSPNDWNADHTITGLATSTTDNAVVRYDGLTGNQQNSVVTIDDTGVISGGTTAISTVTGLATSSTDNAVVRFDLTAGHTQNSGVTIDDSNNCSGIKTAVILDTDTTSTNGTAALKVGRGTGLTPGWTTAPSSTDFVSIYSYIDSTSRPRVWGENINVDVIASNDATAWGLEVNVNNNGTAVSDPTSTLKKVGVEIAFDGPNQNTSAFSVLSGKTNGVGWPYQGVHLSRVTDNGIWGRKIGGDTASAFTNSFILDQSDSVVVVKVDSGTHTSIIDSVGSTSTRFARIGNNQPILYRNAAGSADLQAIVVDSSNNLSIGGSGFPGAVVLWSNTIPGLDATWSLGNSSNRYTAGHFSSSVTLYGATSGNTVLSASSTASGTITIPAATDTLVGKATTDTLTNKTFDTAGAGNALKINGTTVSAVTGSGSVVLATSPTLVTPALGTPSSGTLTSCTGLPISTGVSGLGTSVATFLATPSSANLAAALTDEVGSGNALFGAAWTSYTPTVTSVTGTITTVGTVSGKYAIVGRTVIFRANVTITTNGTGASQLKITLPQTPAAVAAGSGYEDGIFGQTLYVQLKTDGIAYCGLATGGYPGGDNAHVVISGSYEY